MAAAARRMTDSHVGVLPVVAQNIVVGIVTDRDLLTRTVGCGRDPTHQTVASVMTEDVITCRPGDEIAEALRMLRVHGRRRLPVVEAGRLVGIVTLSDLADSPVDERRIVETLSEAAGSRSSS